MALAFCRRWQEDAVGIEELDRRAATFKTAVKLERRDALMSTLMSMLKLAADLRPVADAGDGWDEQPWLLGVPVGVVELTTGTPGPDVVRTASRSRRPFPIPLTHARTSAAAHSRLS
jgi:hypothetical protein